MLLAGFKGSLKSTWCHLWRLHRRGIYAREFLLEEFVTLSVDILWKILVEFFSREEKTNLRIFSTFSTRKKKYIYIWMKRIHFSKALNVWLIFSWKKKTKNDHIYVTLRKDNNNRMCLAVFWESLSASDSNLPRNRTESFSGGKIGNCASLASRRRCVFIKSSRLVWCVYQTKQPS